MNQISFKILNSNITNSEIKFLFELLKDKEYSISHSEIPSFEQHRNFILSNPYYKFAIILLNSKMIGSVYLQNDNTVGLNLLRKFKRYTSEVISRFENSFTPLEPIKSKRTQNFCFFVSPKDKFRQQILAENDYEIVSITFKKKK